MRTIPTFFCVIIVLTSAAIAQQSTDQNSTPHIQSLLGKKNSKDALGQAIVVGALYGCTQKKAGKEVTQTFYNEMIAVGKSITTYCKEGHVTEARALALSTMDANHAHPVYQSALECYDAQTISIASIGGQKMADTMAKYARWAKNTSVAKREINETDVCRNVKMAKG